MDRRTALDILRANEAPLRARGVRHVALFGSVARGEAHGASDLDLMIDLDRAAIPDVFAYAGLCRFIGSLFAVPVDVADKAALEAMARACAERDAVPAF